MTFRMSGDVRAGRQALREARQRLDSLPTEDDETPEYLAANAAVGEAHAALKWYQRLDLDLGLYRDPPSKGAATTPDSYAEGLRDGAAAHRREIGSYNEQLFTDSDYRKGLQDGRCAAIDEELAAAARQDDLSDDSDGM